MRDPTSSASPRAPANRVWTKPAVPKSINRRALVLALFLGALAAVLIFAFLRGGGASGAGPVVPTLQVVVATRDIAAGQEITESMVELKALPETAILGNPATAKEQVVGQVLRYPVAQGEQLVNLRLVEHAKDQILSFQIPKGLRAFTIPVSVNNTPAALMAPGDFVDVLASGPLQALSLTPELAVAGSQASDAGGNTTVTLLQNIQLLAVQLEYVDNGVPYDASVRGAPADGGRVSYVTLALTPVQVQHLHRVSSIGTITLSLRSFGDEEIQDLQPMVLQTVVVASRDISPGQKITDSMAELAAVPETAVIRNAATSPTQVVGQYLRNPVARGEQLSRADLVAEVQVVVAVRDIAAGQKITESMVELIALPETAVIHKAATSTTQVFGQTLRYPVARGAQLSREELVVLQPLSLQIPDGLRAFTIPVGVTSTPVSLMAPGDYVDVLASLDITSMGLTPPTELEGEEASGDDLMGAMTIFQNVQVLAVSREYLNNDVPYDASVRGALPDEGDFSYMTLALTPEQAQLLWLGVAKGVQITVTLRPHGDNEIIPLDPIVEPLQLLPF